MMRIGVLCLAGSLLGFGQPLPPEPARDSGSSITGAFEGWFKNPDGTFSLLLGYYNRNRVQQLDIPIGPNNSIQPGGPDRGQPTHFMPGRGWGLFTVKVPADFGENKITWTIVANGKSTTIPVSLKPDWVISPFAEAAVGNTPPVISFEEHGPSVQGPRGLMVERTARVGEPLPLKVWVSDDAKFTSSSGAKPKDTPPVSLKWIPYRAPGLVTFSDIRPPVKRSDDHGASGGFSGTATTMATFSEPGEYIVLVTANDYSGEGGSGFQCCWTTAQVKVTVQR